MSNDWHKQRRRGIGGSDIAAIMGISPWKTPYQVYLEKRGEAPAFAGNEATDWGLRLEPALRQWYSDNTGREVFMPQGILKHPKHDFILANLDGYTKDRRVVEIKTARYRNGWGEPGSAEVPDTYAMQVHHYMLVSDLDVADVVASIGGAPPEIYTVERDPEIEEIIVEACVSFWARVVEGRAPDPVNYADAVARFGKSKSTGEIVASDEAIQIVHSLKEVRDIITKGREDEEALKGEIITILGDDADTLVDGEGRALVTYRMSKGRTTFDAARLKAEHPEIYEQYLTQGEGSRRFLLK